MSFYHIDISYILKNGGTRHFRAQFEQMIRKQFGPEFESHYELLMVGKNIIYLSDFGCMKLQSEYNFINDICEDESEYSEKRDMNDFCSEQAVEIYQYLSQHIPNSIELCGTIRSRKTGMPLVKRRSSGFTIIQSESYYDIQNMLDIADLIETDGKALLEMMNKYTEHSGLDWTKSVATSISEINTGGNPKTPYIPTWDSIIRAIVESKCVPFNFSNIGGIIVFIVNNITTGVNFAQNIADMIKHSDYRAPLIANSIVRTVNREAGTDYPLLVLRLIKIDSGKYHLEINGVVRVEWEMYIPDDCNADTFLEIPIIR